MPPGNPPLAITHLEFGRSGIRVLWVLVGVPGCKRGRSRRMSTWRAIIALATWLPPMGMPSAMCFSGHVHVQPHCVTAVYRKMTEGKPTSKVWQARSSVPVCLWGYLAQPCPAVTLCTTPTARRRF